MRRRILFLALAGLAACDLPTEPPQWEQTWQVSGEELRVGVAELLPTGVNVSPDGTALLVETPGATAALALEQLCPACSPFFGTGTSFPKPAFGTTFSTTTTLPAQVVAAELEGGSVEAVLSHTFSFDPLNPSSDPADPRGYILVRATSDGNEVAFDSIDGAEVTFAPGETLTPQLPIQPTTVANDIAITVTLVSPAGDPITADGTESISLAVLPSSVELAAVTITAVSLTVAPAASSFDVGDLDSGQVDRIQRGSIIFDVDNPFDIDGSLDITFTTPFQSDITRSLPIEPGSFTSTIEFTGEELQSILDADEVTAVTTGTVSSPAGTLTLTPGQVLVMDTAFRLEILVGGEEEA